MSTRAVAALILLLGLTASAASALAGGAPGCCATAATAHGSAPCGEDSFGQSLSPCCELLPAEATAGSQDARDVVRSLAALAAGARQLAPLRTPTCFAPRPALPRQAAPDSTTVLRI